jgi:hypothetical protein
VAVPSEAYDGILSESIGREMLALFQMHLFDREKEVLVSWMPQP